MQEDFGSFISRATMALGLPAPAIASLLTQAFHKALEFAATVRLDRASFNLAASTVPESPRHDLVQTCTALVNSA